MAVALHRCIRFDGLGSIYAQQPNAIGMAHLCQPRAGSLSLPGYSNVDGVTVDHSLHSCLLVATRLLRESRGGLAGEKDGRRRAGGEKTHPDHHTKEPTHHLKLRGATRFVVAALTALRK
jgi:hypothetical protein